VGVEGASTSPAWGFQQVPLGFAGLVSAKKGRPEKRMKKPRESIPEEFPQKGSTHMTSDEEEEES